MKDWFEIFRAGTHTASNGVTKTWTEEEVEKIAENYNAQTDHEAPIVIGHPKDNDPAYGWVEKLKVEGGKLFAKAKQLVPEFLEAVEKGLYKKRSVSLYPDGTLRHVGFLGAVPPAIKGLAELKFKEGDATEIEFSSSTSLGDQLGNQDDERAALEAKVSELNSKIAELNSFKENTASLQEKLNHAEMSKQEAEQNLTALRLKMRKLEFQQFLNEQVAYGSLTPAQSEQVGMLLEVLDTVNLKEEDGKHIYEFSDGNKLNPVELVKSFVSTLPKQKLPSEPPTDMKEPSEPQDAEQIAKKAAEYREEQKKKGIEVTTVEAVNFVISKKGVIVTC